ncbi:GNAT family N-acetyltransferase [Skermania piniformis]|uniref:GNAT family N-acetyltransferase n=1 Tax=Skermania pinensis TaxID=39122 RepID=A0ABX8S4G7_9ACTN|nr:GNAT family N-acetyltransferase [Skermania piniformis]QXQ12728.1 GNAT family N-acetyltransferase [Skermania piniformis]
MFRPTAGGAPWRVAAATVEHARGIARCHVVSWQESYRGLVPDHVLSALDVDRVTARWARAVDRAGRTRVALIDRIGNRPDEPRQPELPDQVIGFADAGPPEPPPHSIPGTEIPRTELRALYLLRAHQGHGIADALIAAAVGADACQLWVFERNLRAQAFYHRHGFTVDGVRRKDDFGSAYLVRMVRDPPGTGATR